MILYLPWILTPKSAIIALPGDSMSGVWYAWLTGVAIESGQSLAFTKLISAPFGFSYAVSSLLWSKLQLLLSLFFNDVFIYNFLIFISFPLAAFTMYRFAWYVTRNQLVSFVAGFIFSFSPYHLMKALQHLTLANIQWLPLFFLLLIKFHEKRSPANLILLAGSFSLLFLSDYYYGYFALIIVTLIGCFIFIYSRLRLRYQAPEKIDRNNKKFFVPIFAVTLIVIVAAIFPIVSNWIQLKALFGRSISELYVYSARPLEYLTPSIDNPFFGSFVERFASLRLHGSNFYEQTLYLGLVPLILAGIAVFGIRSEVDERSRFAIYFALFGAITAFLFSMPPTINILGLTIPMPSYLSYKIVPVFRVYARFGIFLMMFVALLASIGLKRVLDRIDSGKIKILVVSALLLVIAVEFTNIPPWRVINADRAAAPRVYQWLAEQPGVFIVAEYPWISSAEYSNSEYLFYQRIHKKRLANGAVVGSNADKTRQNLVELEDSDIAVKLRKLGVKYIIVHRNIYKEGMIPDKMKRYYGGPNAEISKIKYNYGKVPEITASGLKLTKRFNNDYVYKVQAPNGLVLAWSKNIGSLEYFGGSKWRWMSNDGELLVTNYDKKPILARINIQAASFFKPRVLEARLDAKILERSLVKVEPKKFTIAKVVLRPGVNKIIFSTKPGAEIADSRIHNGDKRKLSISFGRLLVKEISR